MKSKTNILPNIKTKSEFEQILKELDNQGFYIIDDNRTWQRFLTNEITEANIYRMDINSDEIIRKLKLHSYDSIEEIKNVISEYFSQFNEETKLKEAFEHFYPISIDIPEKEIKEYRQRYLKTNKQGYTWGKFADLNKPTLKLSVFNPMEYTSYEKIYKDYNSRNSELAFKYIIKHILDVNLQDVSLNYIKADEMGVWREYGKLSLKQFKNGNIEIKHPDLDKVKLAYYEATKNKENLFVQL